MIEDNITELEPTMPKMDIRSKVMVMMANTWSVITGDDVIDEQRFLGGRLAAGQPLYPQLSLY